MNMGTGRGALGLVGLSLLAIGNAAAADTITIMSSDPSVQSFEDTASSFTATWTYTPGATGTLTLMLTNTTPAGPEGGAITALAFNTPGGASLSGFTYGESGDNEPFYLDGVTPPPASIGNFNTIYTSSETSPGSGIGMDFTGAGDGMTGIESGETGTFSWTVTSADAMTLSVLDFLDLDLNTLGYGMALKFKGIGDDGDSDTLVLVPLPRSVWFGAMGLVAVVFLRRRFLA